MELDNDQRIPIPRKTSEKNTTDESSTIPLLAVHDLLKVPLRFNIMFLLYNYDKLGFTQMQKLLHTTPGNLDHHLKKLKEADRKSVV